MAPDIQVANVDPKAIDLFRRQLVDCYRRVFTVPPWSESPGAVRWFDDNLPQYAGSRGFRCLIASVGKDFAGFALGMDLHAQQWLERRIASALAGDADLWVPGAWYLTELAVLARFRGRRIGSLLHDEVMKDLPNPAALLTTHPRSEEAMRLYSKRGWVVLTKEFQMWRGADHLLLLGSRN